MLKPEITSIDENPFLWPIKAIRDGVKNSVSNLLDWGWGKTKEGLSKITETIFNITKFIGKGILGIISRIPIIPVEQRK